MNFIYYTFSYISSRYVKCVCICASFDNWQHIHKLNSSVIDNDRKKWTIQIYLSQNIHEYKYIVDESWIIDPNEAICLSGINTINNYVDLNFIKSELPTQLNVELPIQHLITDNCIDFPILPDELILMIYEFVSFGNNYESYCNLSLVCKSFNRISKDKNLKKDVCYICNSSLGNKCETAAEYGHLHCLIFSHKNGYPLSSLVSYFAALKGHLDCLKYIHQQGCFWNTFIMSRAAYGGHIDCLRYLHEKGCPWDENTCSDATTGGHLDCLIYAHENGCPWNKYVHLAMIKNKHYRFRNYLLYRNCPKYLEGLEN